jgi:capsular exopolysaccharide synthesis family protein
MRSNIEQSLQNLLKSKEKELNEIINFDKDFVDKENKMPSIFKDFQKLERQQKIKESQFLYLLEKLEESQIAIAAQIGNAKIIDSASGNINPVSPRSSIVFLICIVLSVIISFLILYFKKLFHDKVYSKSDISRLNLPYLGNIPLGEKNKNIVISRGSKTAISESFRSLRTNADFLLRSAKQKENGNFIFITSTVAKEGKSFTAVNFSLSIALSGKKVLLLGMDLRAPKLEQYLGKEKSKGITNYIVDTNTSIYDYIYQSELDQNLYIFPSGDIPPNQSELLMITRVVELFKQVELDFDFIIVDTPPVGIVTDTLLISHYADVTIYVVRANQLPRRMLNIVSDLFKEKRLNNMAVLLNGTYGSKGYGYGYGYGYGNEKAKKPWYKRIFKK